LRKKLIVANWKMNKLVGESMEFLSGIEQNLSSLKYDLVICPSFISLYAMKAKADKLRISLGAQNCFYEDSGAYTGEVSPHTLADLGAKYVILGHSERRTYFHENGKFINKKILKALENNLKVILCVGEDALQRREKTEIEFVINQLKECLQSVNSEDILRITIAYEPIWAIGTGKIVFSKEAQEMANKIREFISQCYGDLLSGKVSILYGGSVSKENYKEFLSLSCIDGILVGGASLDLKNFIDIITH